MGKSNNHKLYVTLRTRPMPILLKYQRNCAPYPFFHLLRVLVRYPTSISLPYQLVLPSVHQVYDQHPFFIIVGPDVVPSPVAIGGNRRVACLLLDDHMEIHQQIRILRELIPSALKLRSYGILDPFPHQAIVQNRVLVPLLIDFTRPVESLVYTKVRVFIIIDSYRWQ